MGYDAYSYAALGFKVNEQQLSKTVKIRACKHETDETKNFCSECGKPVFVEGEMNTVDTDETYKIKHNGLNHNLKFETYGSGDNPEYVFGLVTQMTSENQGNIKSIKLAPFMQDMHSLASLIRHRLEQLGIEVDLNDFAMHALLYHSY